MCDAMSFVSSFGSYMGGRAEALSAEARGITARGNAQFEAAQMETLNILETMKVRNEQGEMLKDFEEQAKQNAAAAAVSGLDPMSFAQIEEGNRANMQEAKGQMESDLKIRKSKNKMQAKVRRMEGDLAYASAQAEAKAAMFSGVVGAMDSLYTAEKNYQKNNTGESRSSYFFKSIGMGD